MYFAIQIDREALIEGRFVKDIICLGHFTYFKLHIQLFFSEACSRSSSIIGTFSFF